jgi:hypothetical protein
MSRRPYNLTEKGLLARRAAIQKTQPWRLTTGPKTPEGKIMSSLNAFKHGARCRHSYRLPGLRTVNEPGKPL